LLDDVVLIGVDQHGHVFKILRSRTNQRDAADIDLLDRLFERRSVAGHGRFERIQVDNDDRDRRNTVLARFGEVGWILAVGEDPAENARMQRFHAAVEQRRKPGELADVERGNAMGDQMRARAAGRIDRHPAQRKFAREFNDARAIVHREERRCVNRQGATPRRRVRRPPA